MENLRIDVIWLANNMDFDLNIRINQVASLALQVDEVRPDSNNSDNRP